MRGILGWIGISVSMFVTSALAEPPAAAKDEVVYTKADDPAMRKAFARARVELDAFLAKAHAHASHQSDFSVKVGLVDGKDVEYVWISDFSQDAGNRFTGTINNEVEMSAKYQLGDRHSFAKSDIVDWIYFDNDEQRMYGNYTLCVLLTKGDPAEAEAMKRRYKLDCNL